MHGVYAIMLGGSREHDRLDECLNLTLINVFTMYALYLVVCDFKHVVFSTFHIQFSVSIPTDYTLGYPLAFHMATPWHTQFVVKAHDHGGNWFEQSPNRPKEMD